MEILRDLRLGEFDVLVGINLLREGLDLPEVSLVAILDADKEGFLRAETSLIQTIGRAARNADGQVIMYADTITGFDAEGDRRDGPAPRDPAGVQREARHHAADDPQEGAGRHRGDEGRRSEEHVSDRAERLSKLSKRDRSCRHRALGSRDEGSGESLQFERAAELRDAMLELKAGL